MESSWIILLGSIVILFHVGFTVHSVFDKETPLFQTEFDNCLDKSSILKSNIVQTVIGKGHRWSLQKGNVAAYAMENNYRKKGPMEDRFSVVYDKKGDQEYVGLAVYDGHGGKKISEYAEKHILPAIIQRLHSAFSTHSDFKKAIKDEILEQDKKAKELDEEEGSTALIAVLHNNKLYIAHVGDSRAAVLYSNREFWSSVDHKPDKDGERRRIERAGGRVIQEDDDVARLAGVLAVSRALGDASYKDRGLTAEADIKVIDLTETPVKYMILASDGMWDTFESKDALEFIKSDTNTKFFGAKKLAEKAVKAGSRDDVTVMVVKFGELSKTTMKSKPSC